MSDPGTRDLAVAPRRRPLGRGERITLRLRHAGRLGRDVTRFASDLQAWWFVPLMAVLVIFSLAITTTTSALPVAVYVLF